MVFVICSEILDFYICSDAHSRMSSENENMGELRVQELLTVHLVAPQSLELRAKSPELETKNLFAPLEQLLLLDKVIVIYV